MRPIVALRLRTVCAILGVVASTACVSSSVSPHPPAAAVRPPAPAAAPPAPDASYDWHVLLLVPFGTLLKDSPLALHEVLLFHDPAQDTSRGEDKDCYAIDGASQPQFLGRRPDDYLLCFDQQDRLSRIEASVRLPAESAGAIFAAACALWLKTASPASSAAGSCEGRDGATGFSARLGGEPAAGAAAADAAAQSAMTLSISLFSVTDP
ncbi:MAG: hypothetical protein ACLP2F_15695 [Steroidobacteraceae bacterium]